MEKINMLVATAADTAQSHRLKSRDSYPSFSHNNTGVPQPQNKDKLLAYYYTGTREVTTTEGLLCSLFANRVTVADTEIWSRALNN